MKKIILLFLSLCILIPEVYANYSTPGTNKRWNLDSLVNFSGGVVTFSGGFYNVNDTLIISATDTVSILTNSTLRLGQSVFIDVFGTLKISPPDSVKITAQDTNTKYLGFRFNEFADASVLQKMIMEYGNSIRLLDCDMLINNCIIRNNTQNSTFGNAAISIFRSNAIISNNKIFRNRVAAIQSGANIASSPQIINNEIYENNITNANVPQINWGATLTNPPLIIRGNKIRGLFTNAGGIAMLAIGSGNVIIENNEIKFNRYGIALLSGNINAVINNNIIDSNNIQGNPSLGGSGINLNGNSTLIPIIKRNFIRGNLWGVTIQGTAKPNLGNVFNLDTNDNGLNQIYGNGNTGRIYDLFNNTPDSIYAQNNYWGTTIQDSIEAHIFHRTDSAALGYVNYIPFRTVTDIKTNELTPATYSILNVYPNPFNPETTIEFNLNTAQRIKIEVFDVTGRVVEVIRNEDLQRGNYKVKWNAINKNSGVYFLKITGNEINTTRKLLLIK
ncbi:MAG TPA: hypothetical protein DEP28_07290 [Bacteroidetes bacterium]|nr:hypothetical protein [Bacteroidota bacterium]